jgi:hypothetical protein
MPMPMLVLPPRRQEAEAEWCTAQDQGLDPEEEGANAAEGLHQHTRGHEVHRAQAQEDCVRLGRRCRSWHMLVIEALSMPC